MRHLNNNKSVQAQLDELKKAQDRVAILTSELKNYMEENDLDHLEGITTQYTRAWVNDSLQFDSSRFKKENENLYNQYKTKEKAGYFKYEVKAIK